MKVSTVKRENVNEVSSGAQSISTEEILYLPVDDILSRLNTSQAGLTSDEVRKRLEIYGPNEIAKRKKRATIIGFLSLFRNPLVIILLIAGMVSIFYGEMINAVIIFLMVLLSVVLTFYQEAKAEKAAETLKEKVTTTATVLRDGVK